MVRGAIFVAPIHTQSGSLVLLCRPTFFPQLTTAAARAVVALLLHFLPLPFLPMEVIAVLVVGPRVCCTSEALLRRHADSLPGSVPAARRLPR